MPLPFERRWGSDRRKKDEEKKEKRDKKKYKTKFEEQMDRQIEDLSRQLLEEKHNSRRERLTVTRLQRELTQAKKDCSVKDSLMRDLSKERQSRLDTEQRLKEALSESETCKSRLESLQEEFGKMQATMNAVMEYQHSLEQLKQEKHCLVHKYENDIEKCHMRVSNLERENSSLTNEIRNLEAKVTHDEGIRERTLLLERLKHLELENTALVLENENQREQYEHCLDEVANQVVQALLMQKDLREECIKLHNRVQELEKQNHNLQCVFDSRGVCFEPKSMPQPSFQHAYGSPSNGHNNGSLLSSVHPCPVSNPGHVSKPANGRVDHHSDRCSPTPESFSGDKTQSQHISTSSSENVMFSQMYTSHYQSPQQSPRCRPAALQGNNKMKLSSSHEAFLAQTCSFDRYRFKIMPEDPSKRLASFGEQQNGALNSHGIRQLRASPQMYPSDHRGAFTSAAPTVKTSTYSFSLSSLSAKEEDSSPQRRDVWNLIASPSSPQRVVRTVLGSNHKNVVANGQQNAVPVQNRRLSSVTVQPKMNGHQNGELKNGYVLEDKYSQPYVHAPFHYAQSLLQELKEISSSVKSFENLTLDPKPGTQQKRKAEAHNSNSRQKLAKGQIMLPLERDDSLDLENGDGYATIPELLDTSTSSLSSTSVETALERVISFSPTPLSPSWTDEADDMLEISLDDQNLDSSLERESTQSDMELTCETQEVLNESSLAIENGLCIYAKSDANKEHSSQNHIEPNLPDCSLSKRQQIELSTQENRLQSPWHYQSNKPECQMSLVNWKHKGQYACKLNGVADVNSGKEDNVTLCNSNKKHTPCSEKSGNTGRLTLNLSSNASVEEEFVKDKVNMHCLSTFNKMNRHKSLELPKSDFRNQHNLLNNGVNTSLKSPESHCLVRKTSSGPSLYPLSPNNGVFCQSPLICSGPWCTAQKKQIEEEEKINLAEEDSNRLHGVGLCATSPKKEVAEMAINTVRLSQINLPRTESDIISAKEFAEKTALAQGQYVRTAEVRPNSRRNRSMTESCINMTPQVRTDSKKDSSNVATSLLDVTPTPCLVIHSPVNSKVLIKDLKYTCDKPMPCSTPETVKKSNTNNSDDESTLKKADTESASIDDQIPNKNAQILEYQKTPYENRIGSFITPSQEEILQVMHSTPKKSSCIPNPDDRPLMSANASIDSKICWKNTIQHNSHELSLDPRTTQSDESVKGCKEAIPVTLHARSRSLGRNEMLPLSGFIKEDNFRIKKTRSLDRDTSRTPSPRRRELTNLPKYESSPQMIGRNKKASVSQESTSDLKSTVVTKTANQKPSSLKLSLSSGKMATTLKENPVNNLHTCTTNQEHTSDKELSEKQVSEKTTDGSDWQKLSEPGRDTSPSKESSAGITEELIKFKSNSLGENPFLNSVSMESLESDNSDDWGSPCKSSPSDKKAATPLSEFLSSDSDSEEENINFVEMWKAREASPIKLPEWNPQKSVEEHRQKMRQSLSDSNRSSNLDKSSSLSSSTSSEHWLLNYPFTDTPMSPSRVPVSPSKQSRLSFEIASSKQSLPVTGDDDVFFVENGISNRLNKLNSVESRKSTASSRSSLGENSVMFDFVTSILDELNRDGTVKVEPGSPVKQLNDRKSEIDKLNRDKCNSVLQNGHCKSEFQSEQKCNRVNICNKASDCFQMGKCNSDIEVRPVRTFSLDSNISCMLPRPAENTAESPCNKRTNSPSRIPKASKQGTSNMIAQSLRRLTSPKDHNSVNSISSKEKNKESKVKSRIPQLIRNSFRSPKSQNGSSKKRDKFPKVDIIRTARSLPASPKLMRSPILGPKLNGSPKPGPSSNLNDEPKLNGSSSPQLSPKNRHSPRLSNSPRLCASPRMAGSPLLNGSPLSLQNGFSDSMDSLGCGSWNGALSRKSSVASTSSFVVDNVPYIDDSGSSPESQGNRDTADIDNDFCKTSEKSEMRISSPITTAYRVGGVDDVDFREQRDGVKRTNVGLDDQISPEMIEDIKHGRLASNWDSLSLGNQSRTSNYNLKNAYSWSENISKVQGSSEHQVKSLIGECSENAVAVECSENVVADECSENAVADECSVNVVADEECKDEAEAEPCKGQVPLVDEDLMEDFEVDDMCGDDDTGSIRENSAQLTEKERANLLDSLFDVSDDSDDDLSIPHSDSVSSDSHPGEKEFMKMIGEKNKVLKHQVIKHSAIYCRVSIMQVDLCNVYTRFGEKEREALASFDFLTAVERQRTSQTEMGYHLQHPQRIQIHEIDDDLLNFDPMMQDNTSLAGSSDQEPSLVSESMVLGDLMGDSFSSSNPHSFSSSSNSLSSQN